MHQVMVLCLHLLHHLVVTSATMEMFKVLLGMHVKDIGKVIVTQYMEGMVQLICRVMDCYGNKDQ